MSQELINLMQEAERRGDMETAKAVLLKLESMQEPAPVEAPPVEQSLMDQAGQFLQPVGTAVDVARTMGTGMVGQVAGGLVGIGQALNPFAEEGAGARAVSQVQGAITIPPQTERGEAVLQKYGEILEPVGEFVGKFRTGDETLEAGGGPLLATVNEMAPEIVGSMVGLKGIGGKTGLPKPKIDKAGNIVSGLNKKQVAGVNLRNNPADASTAKFKLSNGGVVTDPVGKAALGQGWSDIAVSGVKAANQATKSKIKQMINIARNRGSTIEKNIKTRPSDVLGDSLYKRYQFLDNANKASGKLLGKIAKDLGDKGVKVDISEPMAWFKSKLDEFGVRITETGKVDFSETSLPKSDFGLIKENITQIQRVLKGENNFHNAHKLKQILRRTGLSYEQTAMKKGASTDAQTLFKGLSGKIDEVLDTTSDAYNKQNIKFGETAEMLKPIQKVAKDNLYLDSADKFLGKTMRRITSNAVSRDSIIDMIDGINEVTAKYGGKFDDDLYVLQHIAREMDDVVEVAAKTSIQGELGPQAIAQGLERSSVGHVAKAIENAGKLVGHRSPEKALNTLQMLTN